MFLDSGKFENPQAGEVVENRDIEEGERQAGDVKMVDVYVTKKQTVDPLSTVKVAISHSAYDMLRVID